MDNIFVKYIKDGRIRNLEDLKISYHRIVMKTHPDAVGSDRFVDKYIQYSNFYEQAVSLLSKVKSSQKPLADESKKNYRLLFYREFYRLERIDKPYAFKKFYHSEREIELSKRLALEYFRNWKPDHVELYSRANRTYDQIKQEKPSGPYMKDALLINLTPVFHNITSFQIIGLQVYKKQLKQNLAAIIAKLKERQFHELVEYIGFLITDLENGPAIYEAT